MSDDSEKFFYYDENGKECEREFTPLEKEFLKTQEVFSLQLQAKIEEAEKALCEAVELSEKYGIPFESGVSFLSNTYTPETMEDKFPELDTEWLAEVGGVCGAGEGYGWQHSAVC